MCSFIVEMHVALKIYLWAPRLPRPQVCNRGVHACGTWKQTRNIIKHCNANEANEAQRSHKARINWNQHMVNEDMPQRLDGLEGMMGSEHKNHCNSHSLNRNAASCTACGNFCNYSADPERLPAAKCKWKGQNWGEGCDMCSVESRSVECGANGACG